MPEIFLDMFWRFYGFGFVRFLDRSRVRTGRRGLGYGRLRAVQFYVFFIDDGLPVCLLAEPVTEIQFVLPFLGVSHTVYNIEKGAVR